MLTSDSEMSLSENMHIDARGILRDTSQEEPSVVRVLGVVGMLSIALVGMCLVLGLVYLLFGG